ncbi:unnamed protein product [Rotaria sp. Silwood2]|nr:unnamed protein product [Rotaria sp. Silwood2]CAF3117784.1 unnamed protein product [Rotaria sp. Silwood2]CAF4053712.1 unnamed protein product [Rotaria sp. Silwood2]CAF4222256.1 unnamed protein product [Rotaria sp. Silwood2]
MLNKSESYTISQDNIDRHSNIRLSYWTYSFLIIISTLLYIICLFSSETWFIIKQDTNNETMIYFQSKNICLRQKDNKFCIEPYLPINQCDEYDLIQWTIRCSTKYFILFNKTSVNLCNCFQIPLTNITYRNSIFIFILLILTSLITLSKYCSSKQCILYYLNKYLLLILLISIVSFEFYFIYIIFNDKKSIEKLYRNYFSRIQIYSTIFYSFQIFIIIIHVISIIMLIHD